MRTRHLAEDFPSDHVPQMVSVLQKRSTSLVVVGDLTDDLSGRLVKSAQSPNSGMFIAEHLNLNASMTQTQVEEVLVVLAGLGVFTSTEDGRHVLAVCTSTHDAQFVREHVSAVSDRIRLRVPGSSLKQVRMSRVAVYGGRAPSEPSAASRQVRAFVDEVLDAADASPGYSFVARAFPVIPRDESAAREVVARLLDRGASERVVGEHLRAYGYVNEKGRVGEWPANRVKRLIAADAHTRRINGDVR